MVKRFFWAGITHSKTLPSQGCKGTIFTIHVSTVLCINFFQTCSRSPAFSVIIIFLVNMRMYLLLYSWRLKIIHFLTGSLIYLFCAKIVGLWMNTFIRQCSKNSQYHVYLRPLLIKIIRLYVRTGNASPSPPPHNYF